MSSATTATVRSPRERILTAAAALLAEGGRDAVTTRRVGSAAGVQAATIYRQFGDMRGLLDVVAARGFEAYLRQKTRRRRATDPVTDLRRGWDLHVQFGLGHPALYALMYGDPRPGVHPVAARQAEAVLRELVSAVAAAGRLRVPVDEACRVIAATGVGVVLALLAEEADHRDLRLSATTRDAVVDALTTSADTTGPADSAESPRPPQQSRAKDLARHAIAVRETLGEVGDRYTVGELTLLSELLARLT